MSKKFQSTRPLRGATTKLLISLSKSCISIHAPLAGRDQTAGLSANDYMISIHAPLAGRDATMSQIMLGVVPFQSTRPLRGATTSKTHAVCF